MIAKCSEETQRKIDWNRVWSKKYPILGTYQQEVDIAPYAEALTQMLLHLRREHGYSSQDAMLVLKGILARAWQA